jgi:uncharacterized protein YecE (DUF72 family)
MMVVGCAGFAVPATRYFKEYLFVEVQETHLAVPGPGTVRRWRREAPPGFGKVIETALRTLGEVAKELAARTAVFVAPPDFPHSRANRAALRDFLKNVRKQFDTIVFEPGPAWNPEEADDLAEETQTLSARDPLHHGLSKRNVAYYRLPGPAGHKSRYEDPAIEKLAEIAQAGSAQQATYVFTNVDMFADAKRFKRAVGTT